MSELSKHLVLALCQLNPCHAVGVKDRGLQVVSEEQPEKRYLGQDLALWRDFQTSPNKRGGEWLDPLKTTIVPDQRCMTTWVVREVG